MAGAAWQETAPSTAGSHSHVNSNNANLLVDDHNLGQQQHSFVPGIETVRVGPPHKRVTEKKPDTTLDLLGWPSWKTAPAVGSVLMPSYLCPLIQLCPSSPCLQTPETGGSGHKTCRIHLCSQTWSPQHPAASHIPWECAPPKPTAPPAPA